MCRKLSKKLKLEPQIEDNILDVLINSSKLWLSAEIIACQINYDYIKVYNFLYHHDNIICINKFNQRGELLFAWRDKYWQMIPLKTRILNAITNEIH